MVQTSGPNRSDKEKEENCDKTLDCLLVFPDDAGAMPSGRERLSEITCQLSDLVIFVDRDMNVTFRNKAADILFGGGAGARRCDALGRKSGHCAGDAVDRAFATGSPQRCRMEHCRHVSAPIDMIATPLRDRKGEITECIVIGRELPAVDNSERQRRDMLSMLSHDIKTPITMIRAYTEILLETASACDQENAEILDKIKEAAQSTSVLLDDFVTLSKFDAGCIEISPCPVSVFALVSMTLNSLGRMVEDASASIQMSIPDGLPHVMADVHRFGRVMANVITNALRHGQKGVNVRISAKSDEGQQGSVTIEISDDGPGIPVEDLPYIFDRYYGGSRKGKATGHGLGLAIVKKITEMHGGDVEIKSGEGEGTTVLIRLPSAPSTH